MKILPASFVLDIFHGFNGCFGLLLNKYKR